MSNELLNQFKPQTVTRDEFQDLQKKIEEIQCRIEEVVSVLIEVENRSSQNRTAQDVEQAKFAKMQVALQYLGLEKTLPRYNVNKVGHAALENVALLRVLEYISDGAPQEKTKEAIQTAWGELGDRDTVLQAEGPEEKAS